MTDEAKLKDELNLAYRASLIIEDDLFKQAFVDIEAAYMAEWETSPSRDTEGREKIWMAIKLLKKVRSDLETHIQTGKMARSQLDSLREKVKKFF